MDTNETMPCAVSELPLAIATIPMQLWRKLYTPDVGFERGTIFSELDKPFIGEEAVRNG